MPQNVAELAELLDARSVALSTWRCATPTGVAARRTTSALAEHRRAGHGPNSSYWAAVGGAGRRTVARGVTVRRARIVSEPVSDYIRFEHEHPRHVEAGEQVRWLAAAAPPTSGPARNDFWRSTPPDR